MFAFLCACSPAQKEKKVKVEYALYDSLAAAPIELPEGFTRLEFRQYPLFASEVKYTDPSLNTYSFLRQELPPIWRDSISIA